MNYPCVKLAACLPFIVLVGCGAPLSEGGDEDLLFDEQAQALAAVGPMDLWVYERLPLDSAEKARFFAFADKYDVREIYLEANTLIVENPERLQAFIAEALDRGVKVALLFGNHRWIYPENQAEAVAWTARAARFVESLYRDGRPRPFRIHFDIEPHGLPDWNRNLQLRSNQFLDLLNKLKVAKGPHLKMAVDIPFWYDTKVVSRNGASRPLSEWVIDKADWVSMMNYRDTTARVIEGARSEIAYAGRKGKNVVVGVSAQCGGSDMRITFCDEGGAAMAEALSGVRAAFAGKAGFAGVAAYTYKSARALLP